VTLRLSPATVTLGSSQTQQFTVKITNSPPGVAWSVSDNKGAIAYQATGTNAADRSVVGNSATSFSSGIFASTVTYTAPAEITAPQQVVVTATSIWNKNVVARANITLRPPFGLTGLRLS